MRRATAVFAGLAALAFASSADADGDLQSLLNEAVVTTASKSAETTSASPATSTTVTAEDLRLYGIHSIDEAIDFLSLGVVSSSTMRASDVGARGVLLSRDQGDHILLLVDGHVVNEPLYGAARFERGAGIPMELVDHIEVILGPGSVLYGSNAMLGVINVVTKNAHVFHGTHVVAESEVLKSWRVAAGAGYEPVLFGTKTGLTLELEYYRQDGPALDFPPVTGFATDWSTGMPRRFSRTGPPTGVWGGRAENSYYSEVPSGLLKFKVKNLEVTVHGSTYKRAAPFNHYFVVNDTDFDDARNYELDRSAFVDVVDRERLSQVVQISGRVYGDTFDYQRFMNTSASTRTCSRAATRRSAFRGARGSRSRVSSIGPKTTRSSRCSASTVKCDRWVRRPTFTTTIRAGASPRRSATCENRTRFSAPTCNKIGRPPIGLPPTPAAAWTSTSDSETSFRRARP